MEQFVLKLKDKHFTPSSVLIGGVMWQLNKVPKSLEVRLFWATSGRGTEDIQVVKTQKIRPNTQGKVKIEFTLPNAPYSFSGKLITLTWGVEFIDDTGEHFASEEFILSPTRQEIRL